MKIIDKQIRHGDKQYQCSIVFDDKSTEKRPGILMSPNFLGHSENALNKAKLIAGFGYVVYLLDPYGFHPQSFDEAREAMAASKSDHKQLRSLIQTHLNHFIAFPEIPLLADKIAAIGFCFGGACVLELVRSGTDIPAVVSFHGSLNTQEPATAGHIKASLLVCHGAIDPVVPQEQVNAFQQEMNKAEVDYQFVSFSNTVHSFTNPDANSPGRSQYHQQNCKRAYQMMNTFLAERFA